MVSIAQIASIKAFALPVNIEDKLREAGKNEPVWITPLEAVRAGSELVTPSFTEKEGLLFYENRYVLPNDKAMKLSVLNANHDSKVAVNFGQIKTLEQLR